MFKKLIKSISGKPPVKVASNGGSRSNCTHGGSRLVNKRIIQGREHRSSNPYSTSEVENMNIKYLLEDIKQENTLTPKTIELLEFIAKKVTR